MAGEELIVVIMVSSMVILVPSVFLNMLMLPDLIKKLKIKILKGYGTVTLIDRDRTMSDHVVKLKGVAKVKKGNMAWNVRPEYTYTGRYNKPQMIVNSVSSEPLNPWGNGKEGKDPETYAEQLAKANFIGKQEASGDLKKLQMYLIIALGCAAAAAFFAFSLQNQLEPLIKCLSNPTCELAKMLVIGG